MPLESATYLHQLEPANPAATDQLAQADEHLRLIKQVLKNTFPNINAPIDLSDEQLNGMFTMPIGAILSWYGSSSTIPSGWALCDGREVSRTDGAGTIETPDLRNRVVVGAGTDVPQGGQAGSASVTVNTGAAGGHSHTISGGSHTHTGLAKDHTLTTDEIPAHRHFGFVNERLSYGGLSASNSPPQEGMGSSSGASYLMGGSGAEPTIGRSSSIGANKAHSHELQIDAGTHAHTVSDADNHAHSVTVSTIQPSYGLHFIMKV